jgi:hypothetical protein
LCIYSRNPCGRLDACTERSDRATSARAALVKKGAASTSSFRGVTHHVRTGRYEAHIWEDGKQARAAAAALWGRLDRCAAHAAPPRSRLCAHSFGTLPGHPQIYLGGYASEEGAAIAYDVAAIRCRGPAAAITNYVASGYAAAMEGPLQEARSRSHGPSGRRRHTSVLF